MENLNEIFKDYKDVFPYNIAFRIGIEDYLSISVQGMIDALNTLSERDRELILYRFYKKMTFEEIGKQLGISYGPRLKISQILRKLAHPSKLNLFVTKSLEEYNELLCKYNRLCTKDESPSVEDINDILNLGIESLDIPRRVFNTLRRAGFNTINDIMNTKPYELLKLRDFGKKSLKEVEDGLSKYGLTL